MIENPKGRVFQRTWKPGLRPPNGRGHDEYTFRYTIIQKVQKENPHRHHTMVPGEVLILL